MDCRRRRNDRDGGAAVGLVVEHAHWNAAGTAQDVAAVVLGRMRTLRSPRRRMSGSVSAERNVQERVATYGCAGLARCGLDSLCGASHQPDLLRRADLS